MKFGLCAQRVVHGVHERGAHSLLKALVPGEAIIVARVVVGELGRQVKGDRERPLFAMGHRLKVTFAGQLPGDGKDALLSALTRQSTSDSPASSGGVTLAASTEPSVAT